MASVAVMAAEEIWAQITAESDLWIFKRLVIGRKGPSTQWVSGRPLCPLFVSFLELASSPDP